MHELPADRVQPYDFGDELGFGIRPHAISEMDLTRSGGHVGAGLRSLLLDHL
jgi:hypothetical protein